MYRRTRLLTTQPARVAGENKFFLLSFRCSKIFHVEGCLWKISARSMRLLIVFDLSSCRLVLLLYLLNIQCGKSIKNLRCWQTISKERLFIDDGDLEWDQHYREGAQKRRMNFSWYRKRIDLQVNSLVPSIQFLFLLLKIIDKVDGTKPLRNREQFQDEEWIKKKILVCTLKMATKNPLQTSWDVRREYGMGCRLIFSFLLVFHHTL